MAESDAKISALTAITSADSADELLIIDKSDTTDGLGGTGKKITASNFKADLVAKVSTTVADNIPTFSNTSGSLKDSGKKLADYSLATHNHSGVYEPADANIQSHLSSTSNPHSVTYSQVGAASSSHNHTGTYEPANANIQSHISNTSNPHSVTKTQVGLSNVTNDAQIPLSQKGAASGVAELGSDGKIPSAQIPAIALADVNVVASEAAQLALTAQEGDVCVRTDEDKTYIHNGGTAGTMADWTLMRTPSAANVSSVFGRTGAVAATNGDYTASQITNTPSGNISAITVQAALNELDGDKSATDHTHTGVYEPANANIQSHISSTSNPHSVTASQVGAVPTSRTVNSKALSSDISLTASDVGAKATGADETANVSAASTSAAGKVELTVASEVTTGTSDTLAITPDSLAGSTIFGVKSVQITCFDYATNTATGDGKGYIVIPASLNGMNLVSVHAKVITAGTTGTTDIQIANVTDTQDMLSTKITIDSGETGSDTAATAAVINTSYDDVATNDLLRIDVDAVSTTAAKGLIVTLGFQLP